MENNTEAREALRQAKSLFESGSWEEAIRVLTEGNRQQENGRIETQLVKMRHNAFDASEPPAPSESWRESVPDLFPNATSIPEIPASRLSPELVASAVRHHGSIIVRDLFNAKACDTVRNAIDEAFARSEEVADQKDFDPTPWYSHFVANRKGGYSFGGMERYWITFSAGVLAVDSPRALFRFIDILREAGFDKFLTEYFGERPAFSAKKSTLRRTPPNAPTGWHQDGGYFRADVRALNLWAAFSPCGIDAPSLDVFHKRFEHFVEQGGPGLAPDAVSDENAARCGLEHVVRPEFDAGDALLFDEMALHRTGVDESMTKIRYAMEMWFFAPSMFPREQVPLYL